MKIYVVCELGSECSILHKAFLSKEKAMDLLCELQNATNDIFIEHIDLVDHEQFTKLFTTKTETDKTSL